MCFGKTTRGVDRLNSDKKYLVNAEVWTGTGERLKKGVIVLEMKFHGVLSQGLPQ